MKISKMRRLKNLILGHLADWSWPFPKLSKYLHKIRGVKFESINTVFIGSGVVLDYRAPELIYIGKDVWITVGSKILTHSCCSDYQRKHFGMEESFGEVFILEGVFVGANSVILPGVTIGKGSYIGAGSIVVNDIPEGVLAAGNPARIIRIL